jgi:hypothetical protein
MSKIALTPNASGTGTFTIAAPGTNTDRTLTLPDATGTVNTSGIANEVPAGSAGAPAIYPTGDTNTGIFFPAADTIAFAEGGSEVARFDADGDFGVGTTSPSWRVDVLGSSPGYRVRDSGSTNGSVFQQVSGGNTYINVQDNAALILNTNNTERARIDSSGNLLVGTTSAGGTGTTIYRVASGNSGAPGAIYFNGSSSSTEDVIAFQHNGSNVGRITRSTTATAYVTSSDYRLKENVQPMQDALAKIAQLNPVTYTWKVDGSDGQGFIAHELQAVVPDCVTGEKDAVDAEGNPQYQGVDTSFLVATLVKAVQELTARVAELEAN